MELEGNTWYDFPTMSDLCRQRGSDAALSMQGRVHDGVVSYERRRGDGGRGESRHENSESVRSHLCAVVCMEGGVGAITHTSGVHYRSGGSGLGPY